LIFNGLKSQYIANSWRGNRKSLHYPQQTPPPPLQPLPLDFPESDAAKYCRGRPALPELPA